MNSRSRIAQANKEKYPILRNARDFLTGLLFLSVIWALVSRVMTKLGIIPSNSLLGSGTSTKEMATKLSGNAPLTPDMLRKAPDTTAPDKNKPAPKTMSHASVTDEKSASDQPELNSVANKF